MPPSTSSCCSSCATHSPRSCRLPESRSGRGRSSTPSWPTAAAPGPDRSRGGEPPGCTTYAVVAPWPSSDRCGRPATSSRAPATSDRDRDVRTRDIAPGRVLRDAAIIDAALSRPTSVDAVMERPIFRGRAQRREADRWFRAIARAEELPESDLPTHTVPTGALPPARTWRTRAPEAAARLQSVRSVLAEITEETAVPAENVLAPEAMRRLAWQPPDPPDTESVAAALEAQGARPWQRALVSARLAEGLSSGADP